MSDTTKAAVRPPVIGLSHMSFQVSDMDKALAFYKNILGYRDFLPLEEGKRVYVRVNELQYVELQPEHTPKSDRLIRFGFQVENAEAMRAYLAGKGAKVPLSTVINELGHPAFRMRDPDGHTVEFIQYVPKKWPLADGGKPREETRVSACLLHFGFTCYVLEKSLSFYRDTLGFVEMWRGSSDDKTLSWLQLRLGEDPKRNYIELMLYDEALSLERLGIMNHYGLEVSSVPASVEGVMKLPAFKEYARPLTHKIGTCRHRLSNLFDPDGTRAELMERATYDGSVTPSSPTPPPR